MVFPFMVVAASLTAKAGHIKIHSVCAIHSLSCFFDKKLSLPIFTCKNFMRLSQYIFLLPWLHNVVSRGRGRKPCVTEVRRSRPALARGLPYGGVGVRCAEKEQC